MKCNARKLVEFDSVEQHVTVYHIGYHSCTPKADSARYDSIMTEALSENMSLGPTSVKRLKVGEAVSKGNVEDGLNIAKRYTVNRMKYLKQKNSRDMNPYQHSFEAVAIYKKELDKT